MGESASLTQRCALGSRLRFHRLDRLGRLCLLHSFFEPPVPLVFIPLHHGLHSGDPRRTCSSSYVVSALTQLLTASHARCAYAAADSVSGIRARWARPRPNETFSPGISRIRGKRSPVDMPAAETTPSFKAFNSSSRVSLGRPDMNVSSSKMRSSE